MPDKIKSKIKCINIAPIEGLNREIQSNSLKIGVFANNGSGKTFISRMFRLSESPNLLELEDDDTSPTDKLISLDKNNSEFAFSIIDKEGESVEDFEINLNRGEIPKIPPTKYLYHTFNQDYVEENIRALGYEKDSEIEGFILGKANIDLKDDEDKLARIKGEENTLIEQVKNEIKEYLDESINGIQNIRRLTEYRNLTFESVFQSIDKESIPVSKSFNALLGDYNKIKSVPENLPDIVLVDRLKIDFAQLTEIKQKSESSYSLSSLAEEFKTRVKERQSFIEAGMEFLMNDKVCPFCEQELGQGALFLIDNYTKYLTDSEAQTIRVFKSYKSFIEDIIRKVESIDTSNSKRVLEFDTYKNKYIPSCAEIELKDLSITPIVSYLNKIDSLIDDKLANISVPINIDPGILNEVEKIQALLNNSIEYNNNQINSINSKKNRISNENKNTRKELCNSAFNYLASTHKTNIKSIIRLGVDHNTLQLEIKKKKEQQKVSKKDKVAETIKIILNYFFSNKYTLDTESFRLVFNRSILERNQAKNVLSEGEKNIVAFAYYLGDCHLKIYGEDDYSRLFLIIDDPISSMDFTHVYTLSGVLRDLDKILSKLGRVKFILFTHNNDFMRVLSTNNIVDKKLLLKNGELIDFNNNLTVPYINHLFDIYEIARNGSVPNHTTANSIRHIVETLTKFEKIDSSRDSIAQYIRDNIPEDTKAYTLINDLSHGGWRSEQAPITDDDFSEVCSTIIDHIEKEHIGQIEYCKKVCS